MRNLSLKVGRRPELRYIEYVLVAVIALLLWFLGPKLFALPNGNSEEIATSIGLMVLLSMITFALVLGLVGWLMHRFWLNMGLPALEEMVLEFRTLELWEQLKFSVALFALLLLACVGCIIAVV
uniref:hypothetical protein n=1 Tax=Pedobacter schmidteae TaxID=2201271 RepID=UPI0013CE7D94|nr:hypothetical protein [Pedobacter schmidteae]